MSLSEYRRKRDPAKTPEPLAGDGPGGGVGKPIFVVQRHDARRLHYDFRLERNGALASWAVPKGVPLEPGARSLAVHVEDHPLEYASFHGEIPGGEYGAGSVEVFDHGTYDLLEEKRGGQLTVFLHGERLRGRWTLVPARLDGKEQNWLLIKGHDGDGDESARRSYRPMLATPDTELPRGAGWVHEVKFDGYRAIAYVRGGVCRLVSRNGNDLTERFRAVAQAIARAVKSPNAVVDGELCRLTEDGRSSFSELQQGTGPLVYFAFDLLELDGVPRVDEPLRARKAALRELLDPRIRSVAFSDSFDDGAALLDAARERGLEGIVSKKLDSPYREGRRTRGILGGSRNAGRSRCSGRRSASSFWISASSKPVPTLPT